MLFPYSERGMNKRIVLIIIIAVTAVLLSVWLICVNRDKTGDAGKNGTASSEPVLKTDEELIEAARYSGVMVTAGEKHASGVITAITDNKVVLLTAGHLMDGFDKGIITMYNNVIGFADVIYRSDNPDLCVMTFERNDLGEDFLATLSEAPVDVDAYNALAVGDEVFLSGSAVGQGSNATKGTVSDLDYYVSDFDANLLFVGADVFPGMSGCPVYDMYGRLIAILVGGSEYSEAVCVKAADIAEVLRELEAGGYANAKQP